MISQKPYAWLFMTSATPKIFYAGSVAVPCDLKAACRTEITDGDALYVIFTITGTLATPGVQQYTPTTYSPRVHNRIIALFERADGTNAGFIVMKPVSGYFDPVAPTTPSWIPLQWLKVIDAAHLKAHVAIPTGPGYKLKPAITRADPDHFQYLITLKIEASATATDSVLHISVALDDSSGFDPVCDNIVVEVIEVLPGGIERKKGHGTTTGSEGDASSDS